MIEIYSLLFGSIQTKSPSKQQMALRLKPDFSLINALYMLSDSVQRSFSTVEFDPISGVFELACPMVSSIVGDLIFANTNIILPAAVSNVVTCSVNYVMKDIHNNTQAFDQELRYVALLLGFDLN